MQRVCTDAGAYQLRCLIEAHVEKTGSPKGKALLADWAAALLRFWQLVPPAEKNTPEVNPNAKPVVAALAKVAVSA